VGFDFKLANKAGTAIEPTPISFLVPQGGFVVSPAIENTLDVDDAQSRIAEIVQAIQILTHSPLIGRPVKGGIGELVIGRDSRGYTALYLFEASIDTVFVLALRSQRESGYKRQN